MNKKTTYTIAKYKPWLYLPQWGPYQGKEFTSVSDIGYEKDGMIVTVNDYLYWENNYIAFIMDILNRLHISWLEITESGKYRSEYKKNPRKTIELLDLFESIIYNKLVEPHFRKLILSIDNHSIISYSLIPEIIKIYIRGFAWSHLSNAKHKFELYISDDSYFYVTTTMPELELIKIAAKYGLYVNPRNYIEGYPINVDDFRIV